MALMPGAVYKPINYSGVPRMRSAGPNVLIFHTIVGHDPAPAAHFSLGGYGELTQSRDTLYQSAACLNGNPRAVAVETEDMGAPFPDWNTDDGHQVPGWSEGQLNRAVDICVWAHQTYGIPLQLAADSKTGSPGVAYHRQGIDGNFTAANGYAYPGRVSGGEYWSEHVGKVCPGDRRIKQLIEIVIPRARERVGLEVDMDSRQDALLQECRDRLASMHTKGYLQVASNEARSMGGDLQWFQTQMSLGLTATNAMLSEILAAEAGDLSADNLVARLTTHMDEAARHIEQDHKAQIDELRREMEEGRDKDREAMVAAVREAVPEELADDVIRKLSERLQRPA